MALFTLLPHCLSLSILLFDFSSSPLLSLVLPENLASRAWKDGYFKTLVSHLLHLPAFQIMSYSSSLGFIGLSCGEQSKLGFGNKTTT